MTIYNVTNLNDSNSGSLRQAIINANGDTGGASASIAFTVRGTIQLASALPPITRTLIINGATAPGYVAGGPPVVQVNCNGNQGVYFASGSDGSQLLALSVCGSNDTGVTLDADGITLNGNYIGIDPAGAARPNFAAGVAITPRSTGNFIGLNPAAAVGVVANVISGNTGYGIIVQGSSGNVIVSNRIGTSPDGSRAVGNGGVGVFLTGGATGNTLGGNAYIDPATGIANDPTGQKGKTAPVLVVPPLGNQISGNRSYGVVIDQASHNNTLMGNFIGTTANGDAALGNGSDGVWISDSNEVGLIGCRFENDPFVFYNVCGGNGGNGLRITNSNDVIVHANFFGIGADNATVVANRLNGILVEGTSQNTRVGGAIPLGNVSAGNGQNGIEVRDTASGFLTFNTFGGVFAFAGAAPNGGNGLLLSTTGGDITVRTNVWSGNVGHGIEITGDASGITMDPNFCGIATYGGIDPEESRAYPNGGDGLRIGGTAHAITIGGDKRSIMPRSLFGANGGNGIAIIDQAYDISVVNSYIGLNVTGREALGNRLNGILIGDQAHDITIGDELTPLDTKSNIISANAGSGILMQAGTSNIAIIRNAFGCDNVFDPVYPNLGGDIVDNGATNVTRTDNIPPSVNRPG